ncbi:MAG: DUF1036 domain-containing protein [Patescibacteria group bacterium]
MRHLLALAGLLIALSGFANSAWAELQICNRTNENILAAVAHPADIDRYLALGWYRIQPGDCQTVGLDPHYRFYFVHAMTESMSVSWMNGENTQSFCTRDNESFRLLDHERCDSPGQRFRQFFRVDTGPDSARVRLNLHRQYRPTSNR